MKLSYDLAKELKDAGFPQEKPNELWCLECKRWRDISCFQASHEKEAIKLPTLEELIEACGEDFIELCKYPKIWDAKGGWEKVDEDCSMPKFSIVAPTPTEAVARLWLVLNKK